MTNAQRPAGMSLDEYMKHSNRGGRGKYLKGWKDKDPFAVTVWLSCLASIYTLWRHGFQKVEVVTNKETKESTRQVWMNKLVCYEREEILSKQYWRDKTTGEREYPPEICPHCIMMEDVRRRIVRNELSWVEPLFRFEGTDPSKNVTIHAGGLVNMFGAKDLTQEQKKEMAAVPRDRGGPVFSKNAFKQNNWAKMEYVYSVVNHDDVGSGVTIAIEPNLLGDKMKTELAKQMKRLGTEKGNPLRNPYPFRWEHNPAEDISFDKKYDATALDQVRLTPAIEKLIRETDPPDVGPLLEKFNPRTHRALLERHACVKLPWDDYFGKALAVEAAAQAAAAKAAETTTATEVGRSLPAPPPQRPAAPAPEPEFGCDALVNGRECGNPMFATDTVCAKCGAKYDVVAAAPPPPPALPPRSAARPPAASPPPVAAQGSLGPLAPPGDAYEGSAQEGDTGDDIPF